MGSLVLLTFHSKIIPMKQSHFGIEHLKYFQVRKHTPLQQIFGLLVLSWLRCQRGLNLYFQVIQKLISFSGASDYQAHHHKICGPTLYNTEISKQVFLNGSLRTFFRFVLRLVRLVLTYFQDFCLQILRHVSPREKLLSIRFFIDLN